MAVNPFRKKVDRFLKNLFGSFYIKRELKVAEISENIKRDIDYKGYNAWILGASILIASIGLNINSTAAVIGAMLISPLMGPIIGAGYSIGTNDWPTLVKSLKNLGLAISISLVVSFLYFKVSPIDQVQSELLARTSPTLLDVIIAFVGGIAGILAVSRKEKASVLPGVAIAAALMPPLCTAGFGLAIGNFSYFLGAFYLFLINCVFICAATIIFIRYFKFPRAEYDKDKEKRARRYVLIFTILTLIPSGFMLFKIVQKSNFNTHVDTYIAQVIKYDGCVIISKKVEYDKDGSTVDLVMIGKHIPDSTQEKWKEELQSHGLSNVTLHIIQPHIEDGSMASNDMMDKLKQAGFVDEVNSEDKSILEIKDRELLNVKTQLDEYKSLYDRPVKDVTKELKTLYPGIDKVGYSILIQEKENNAFDTLPYMIIKTKDSKYLADYQNEQDKMSSFLKTRMHLDTLIIQYK